MMSLPRCRERACSIFPTKAATERVPTFNCRPAPGFPKINSTASLACASVSATTRRPVRRHSAPCSARGRRARANIGDPPDRCVERYAHSAKLGLDEVGAGYDQRNARAVRAAARSRLRMRAWVWLPGSRSSFLTPCWREMDSNYRFRVGMMGPWGHGPTRIDTSPSPLPTLWLRAVQSHRPLIGTPFSGSTSGPWR
jgi:hypothetical protein